METKEQLRALITASSLSESDKKDWIGFMDMATEEVSSAAFDVLSRFPAEISWFNLIYKRKKEALTLYTINRNKAQTVLDQIYTEEKNKLQLLLNQI